MLSIALKKNNALKKIMLGYYALRVGMQPSHSIEAEVCISLQRIVGEVTSKA